MGRVISALIARAAGQRNPDGIRAPQVPLPPSPSGVQPGQQVWWSARRVQVPLGYVARRLVSPGGEVATEIVQMQLTGLQAPLRLGELREPPARLVFRMPEDAHPLLPYVIRRLMAGGTTPQGEQLRIASLLLHRGVPLDHVLTEVGSMRLEELRESRPLPLAPGR